MVTRLDRQLTACDLDGLPHEWDTLSIGGDVLPEPGLVWEDDGEDNVSPDLAVLIGKTAPEVGKLRVCPEIVIEVLRPGEESRRRDLEAKRDLYWRRGASEYWIIDVEKQTVLRLSRGKKEWSEERLNLNDRIATPLLAAWPGLPVSKVFG